MISFIVVQLLFARWFGTIRAMSIVQIKGINPAWPENSAREHASTEIAAPFKGANSPFGDDVILPKPAAETGYVHPYTRINK